MSYLTCIGNCASSTCLAILDTAKDVRVHMRHAADWCATHKSTCVLVSAAAVATILIGSTHNPLSHAVSHAWTKCSKTAAKILTSKMGATLTMVICVAGFKLYRTAINERDAAIAARNRVREERDIAVAASNEMVLDRNLAHENLNRVETERDAVIVERDAAVLDLNLANENLNRVETERDAVIVERDAAVSSYNEAHTQLEKLRAQYREIRTQRDQIRLAYDVVAGERHEARLAQKHALEQVSLAQNQITIFREQLARSEQRVQALKAAPLTIANLEQDDFTPRALMLDRPNAVKSL